jgi:hypothetical protein
MAMPRPALFTPWTNTGTHCREGCLKDSIYTVIVQEIQTSMTRVGITLGLFKSQYLKLNGSVPKLILNSYRISQWHKQQELHFEQDDTPQRFALDNNFSCRWNGCRGPV